MSRLPYPVSNPELPYPEQGMTETHGQTAPGALPYPMSATSELFPCPPIPHPSQNPYQTEPNIPCVMFPYPLVPSHMMPQPALGNPPYPSDGQIGAYNSGLPQYIHHDLTNPIDESSPAASVSSTPFVLPHPTGEYEGSDSIETVEYNDGLRKDIFSRSGLLGRAINKGKFQE